MARNPKIEHIKAKVRTRGDLREVGTKYLSRLYPIVHHMHEVLRLHANDKASIQTSIHQYVITLASHLETFFRDVFRFALEYDVAFFDRILKEHRLRLPADGDLSQQGVTRYDFVAETMTLQSSESIANIFDSFFLPDGFRSFIENTQCVYGVPSRSAVTQGFPLSAFPSWWQDFTQIFELRHELVHDANSTLYIERQLIARLESLAVILPQYVVLMLLDRFNKKTYKTDNVPAIFLVEDFLAKDWYIVP
ncbi:hypothetical protein [Candidatus Electronema sp. PJ]|uniref:hypothetical protein n=1 Tax=Candidatus Electronema sp. PJ TaxID=3401572 RepID=UPI003AA7F325